MIEKIILKRSDVNGKIPLPSDLVHGEVALNYEDGKLYYKNTNETVISLNTPELATKAPINNPTFTGTVSGITKAHVGLSVVDNTSDALKPISNATQIELDDKVDKVNGQGLSDENYTLAEKNKLDVIIPGKLINGVNEVELGEDANLYLAQGGGIVFDRNNTSINVGMGFHIRSGEGVAIEPVDQEDSENLITRGWYFSPDGSLIVPNNDYYYARSYIILNTFPAQDSGFGLTTPDGTTHDFFYDYDGIVSAGTSILVDPSTDSIVDVATKTIAVLNDSALFGDIHWDTQLNYIWVYQNIAGETGDQINYNYSYADGVSAFTGGQSSSIVFGDGTSQNTAAASSGYLLDRAHHIGTQSHSTITGLGTLATQDGTFSNTVNIDDTQTISGAKEFTISPVVPPPTESNHAVTKAYVDDVSAGLHVHQQVHVILTVTLAFATGGSVDYTNGTDGVGAKLTVTGGSTIIEALNAQCGADDDLVAGTDGSRIIINGESDNKNWNGIYIISNTRELTRAADFDSSIEMAGGDFVFVTHGITHADTGWVLSEPVVNVGSSPVEFVQFSGSGSYDSVINRTLTSFSSAAGTVGTEDTIVSAIGKLDGNIIAAVNNYNTTTTLNQLIGVQNIPNKISEDYIPDVLNLAGLVLPDASTLILPADTLGVDSAKNLYVHDGVITGGIPVKGRLLQGVTNISAASATFSTSVTLSRSVIDVTEVVSGLSLAVKGDISISGLASLTPLGANAQTVTLGIRILNGPGTAICRYTFPPGLTYDISSYTFNSICKFDITSGVISTSFANATYSAINYVNSTGVTTTDMPTVTRFVSPTVNENGLIVELYLTYRYIGVAGSNITVASDLKILRSL